MQAAPSDPFAFALMPDLVSDPSIVEKNGTFFLCATTGGWEQGLKTAGTPMVRKSKDFLNWRFVGSTFFDDLNGNGRIVYHAYENGRFPLVRQMLLDPIWTDDGSPVLAETPRIQWSIWRNFEGNTPKDGPLQLAAKGDSPKDGRLLLTTATDLIFQAEASVDQGTSGGLIIFYNEKAFAGIVSDGKQFVVYEDAGKSVRYTNPYGKHLFVKIVNQVNSGDLLASGDGRNWKIIRSGLDVSQMHHNKYCGFFRFATGPCIFWERISKSRSFCLCNEGLTVGFRS